MSRLQHARRLALILAPLLAYACSDTAAPEPAPTVASVAILTQVPTIHVGDTLSLTAVARDADGEPITDSVPTWSSSNADVLAITPAGRARAVAPGTATLRATAGAKFDAATVQVLPAQVGSIEFLTARSSFVVGDTITFVARPLDADGAPIDGHVVTWSSSAADVIAIGATGKATAVAPGSAMIRATVDGKFHEVEVFVQLAPVALVELSATTLSLVEFEKRQLTVTAYDSAGRVLPGRPTTWITDNDDVAIADANGQVTARAVGTATIRAEIEGKSASVAVSVAEAPVAEIAVTPTPIVLAIGETRQLTAVVKDSAGNVLPGRVVTWASDATQTVMVSSTGMVYGVARGYATILASSGGKTVGIGTTVTSADPDAMEFDLIYHRWTTGIVGEIMIASTVGTGAPTRINAGNVSRQPSPSPDGTRIAFFVSQKDPATGEQMDDIYAVDRNGMNMKRLTSEQGFDGEPAWSPDGTRIAYRRVSYETGRSSIWVMKADGTGKQNLTPDLEGTHSLSEPAWSADGSRILFSAITAVTPTEAGIWSMAADGGDRQQHTSTATGYDQGPSMSPDGQRIAFTRRYDDNERDLVVLTLATGAVQRIPLQWAQWSPAWSPDGRHIAFYQDIGYTGSAAIYTVRADGTHLQQHTPVEAFVRAYDPQWIRR